MPKSTNRSKKIVFFFPSFASSDATAPLGILAVATPLLRAGYEIVPHRLDHHSQLSKNAFSKKCEMPSALVSLL